MSKNLTAKESEFIKSYIVTGDKNESYLKAYDSKSRGGAYVESTKLLNKPKIKSAIVKAITEEGLNETLIAKFLRDLLNSVDMKKATPSDGLKVVDILLQQLGHKTEIKDTVTLTVANKDVKELDSMVEELRGQLRTLEVSRTTRTLE